MPREQQAPRGVGRQAARPIAGDRLLTDDVAHNKARLGERHGNKLLGPSHRVLLKGDSRGVQAPPKCLPTEDNRDAQRPWL